ncbi:MAG TPA: VOC family protein [Bacteroidales bacterium]|nr:VOC family protein [Bacteroidales bacterium]
MKLEHIAITINLSDEIINFYERILGMEQERNFVLDKTLSTKIFGVNENLPVYLMKREDFVLEIFIYKQKLQSVNHLCISVENRENLIKEVQEKGYETIIIEREQPDLVFIKDKSGNIFEIKQQ